MKFQEKKKYNLSYFYIKELFTIFYYFEIILAFYFIKYKRKISNKNN